MRNKISDKTIGFFLQARTKSTRLPNKLLLPLKGKSILIHIIERLKVLQKYYNYLVVLVPQDEFEKIQNHLQIYPDVIIFPGEPENVLKRFYDANKKVKADIIVRVTGDNPLIDTYHLKKGLINHLRKNSDYTIYKNLPLGTGFEIFNKDILSRCYKDAKTPAQKEHVTLYIRENKEKFKILELTAKGIFNHPHLRLTVDEESDYELMEKVYNELYQDKPLPLDQVIRFLEEHPDYLKINAQVKQKQV